MSGKLTLISSATASSSTSVDFTSGITSAYDEYIFYGLDINPSVGGAGADGPIFGFQSNAVGGSGFNETITSTAFGAYHREDGASSWLGYTTSMDQANGTSYQPIATNVGSLTGDSLCYELHLFSPSSTSKVKHFYCRAVNPNDDDPTYSWQYFVSGYINTISAIDEISFNVSSGNFDGNIYLFGVS
jgi:hypothetical protein